METKPLSNREYYALRELFGVVNSFSRNADELRRRAQSIEGAEEKLDKITGLAEELMFDLLKTIPTKKLLAIRKELEHTVCYVKVIQDYTKTDDREFVYIPAEAVDGLVNRVINMECLVCEKNAKQAKKCKVWQDITPCYPWEIKPKNEALCPFAGCLITD